MALAGGKPGRFGGLDPEACHPAMVLIRIPDDLASSRSGPDSGDGFGTGFLVTPEGLLLTVTHNLTADGTPTGAPLPWVWVCLHDPGAKDWIDCRRVEVDPRLIDADLDVALLQPERVESAQTLVLDSEWAKGDDLLVLGFQPDGNVPSGFRPCSLLCCIPGNWPVAPFDLRNFQGERALRLLPLQVDQGALSQGLLREGISGGPVLRQRGNRLVTIGIEKAMQSPDSALLLPVELKATPVAWLKDGLFLRLAVPRGPVWARSPRGASPSSASASEIDWEVLRERMAYNDPHVEFLSNVALRSWNEADQQNGPRADIEALMEARVRMMDNLVRLLFQLVDQNHRRAPRSFSLVARGGYGAGLLCYGSDLDVTSLHEPGDQEQAEEFHKELVNHLRQTLQEVKAIRIVAPAIATMADLERQYAEVFGEQVSKPLEGLVSFSFSRPLAGNPELHDRARSAWRSFVRQLSPTEIAVVVQKLRAHLQAQRVDPRAARIHVKQDAGGLLDVRLARFVTQVLTARDLPTPGFEKELLKAQRFLLRLRDAVQRTSGTPVLVKEKEDLVAFELTGDGSLALSGDGLHEQLASHRLQVRATLVGLVDALEGSVNADVQPLTSP